MSAWILIAILVIIALGTIVLFVAVFTELGTKHKSGAMKSNKAQHKLRKK